jgi:hypothetical protein
MQRRQSHKRESPDPPCARWLLSYMLVALPQHHNQKEIFCDGHHIQKAALFPSLALQSGGGDDENLHLDYSYRSGRVRHGNGWQDRSCRHCSFARSAGKCSLGCGPRNPRLRGGRPSWGSQATRPVFAWRFACCREPGPEPGRHRQIYSRSKCRLPNCNECQWSRSRRLWTGFPGSMRSRAGHQQRRIPVLECDNTIEWRGGHLTGVTRPKIARSVLVGPAGRPSTVASMRGCLLFPRRLRAEARA